MTGPSILLVCANYATDNHTGGFRWRSMVRELSAAGWRFDVVCRAAPHRSGPVADERIWPVAAPTWSAALRTRLAGRRAGAVARRERAPAPAPVDPGRLTIPPPGTPLPPAQSVRMAVNAACDLHEGRAWARAARLQAPKGPHDMVIATIPELEAATAAAAIARDRALPLVVEYRDPLYYGRGVETRRLDPMTAWATRRGDRAIAARADGIVDVSWKSWRDGIAGRRADRLPAPPSACIPHGHDPRVAGAVDPDRFRILHAGWIWPFMPLPALIAAVGRLAARHPTAPVSLDLLGSSADWNGVPLTAMAAGAGIGGALTHHARVPRSQAAAAMDAAAVLVAFDSVCANGAAIPSKMFHYALSRGRMLLIGRADGSMAEEAARIGAPVVPPDAAALDAALEAALADWRAGALTKVADPAGRFAVSGRAAEMSAFLRARIAAAGQR